MLIRSCVFGPHQIGPIRLLFVKFKSLKSQNQQAFRQEVDTALMRGALLRGRCSAAGAGSPEECREILKAEFDGARNDLGDEIADALGVSQSSVCRAFHRLDDSEGKNETSCRF